MPGDELIAAIHETNGRWLEKTLLSDALGQISDSRVVVPLHLKWTVPKLVQRDVEHAADVSVGLRDVFVGHAATPMPLSL
jgi:hypothetical protein